MALFFRQPMRFRSDDAGLTVRAVTGTHAALLALDLAPAARPGLLGFAVHRRRASASSGDWLSNKRHALPQSPSELGLADALADAGGGEGSGCQLAANSQLAGLGLQSSEIFRTEIHCRRPES